MPNLRRDKNTIVASVYTLLNQMLFVNKARPIMPKIKRSAIAIRTTALNRSSGGFMI